MRKNNRRRAKTGNQARRKVYVCSRCSVTIPLHAIKEQEAHEKNCKRLREKRRGTRRIHVRDVGPRNDFSYLVRQLFR